MRKLASVQTIVGLSPIQGADAIEMARVLGWQLVVKKGEFQAGDLCVYVEIDSVLPERAEFEFLRKSCYSARVGGFRIKTARMRGQISQGICFPLSIFPEITEAKAGDDLTETLGVHKYEPPMPQNADAKGAFPGFIPKTDEMRVQSVPEILNRHRGALVYATVKLDGSSCTVFCRDGETGVCSRNLELLPGGVYWRGVQKYGLPDILAEKGLNIALQGELVGEGLNGNRQKLIGVDFYVFSGYSINESRYLNIDELETLSAELGFKLVPRLTINGSETFTLNHTVDEIVAMAAGDCLIHPGNMREGIVIRAVKETADPEVGRLSFKAIDPEYLLKHKD